MTLTVLLCYLIALCLQLAKADSVTRTPDVLLKCDQVRNTLVERKAQVKYEYCLSSKDIYTQFPDLRIEFDLDYDQRVNIKYKIALQTGASTFFITRVIIDGRQNEDFRSITGHLHYHTLSGDEYVWLTKGRHYAYVQYRTNSTKSIGYWDWTLAYLKVIYYQQQRA